MKTPHPSVCEYRPLVADLNLLSILDSMLMKTHGGDDAYIKSTEGQGEVARAVEEEDDVWRRKGADVGLQPDGSAGIWAVARAAAAREARVSAAVAKAAQLAALCWLRPADSASLRAVYGRRRPWWCGEMEPDTTR